MKTFNKVLKEVMNAYSDCNEVSKSERNLNFLASDFVTVNEAIAIMDKAIGSYNEFEPKLLDYFNVEGFDVKIKIAREYSVCIYVSGVPENLVIDKWHNELKADEVDREGDLVRVWWD